MPFEYAIQEPARRLTLTTSPPIDFEQCMAILERLGAERRLFPGYSILVDGRTSDYAPSHSEGRHLIEAFTRYPLLGKCRWALVVSGSLNFGAARMISLMAQVNGFKVEAFDVVQAAENWLGME